MEVRPVTLEGVRAKLVPLSEEHLPDLLEAAQSRQIWAYMPTNLQTVESLQKWHSDALRAQAAGTEQVFTIIDKETGKAVGSTRFMDISAPNWALEIGWTWLAPDVWRTRINTECKYLLLKHCFETLSAIRVQLKTDSRNLRSQKAMERLGSVREGVLRRHRILPDGYVRDSVYYSILPEEWAEVKARLERFLAR